MFPTSESKNTEATFVVFTLENGQWGKEVDDLANPRLVHSQFFSYEIEERQEIDLSNAAKQRPNGFKCRRKAIRGPGFGFCLCPITQRR
jgi:hypothetical protein